MHHAQSFSLLETVAGVTEMLVDDACNYAETLLLMDVQEYTEGCSQQKLLKYGFMVLTNVKVILAINGSSSYS